MTNYRLHDIPYLHEDGFKRLGGRYSRSGMSLYGKGGGGGGGGSAPAPDPNVGIAALQNVQLGREWLAFSGEQFKIANARQDKTDALNEKVVNQQYSMMVDSGNWAKEDRQRTKDVFQPMEDRFINEANTYDSAAKLSDSAAQARADVQQSNAAAQEASQRNMMSMGVNPASGKFAGITRANDLNGALAMAGSQNSARQQVRDKAMSLRADAINIGKGLPSSTVAAYGISNGMGNSMVANNQSGNQNFFAGQGIMNTGYQGAIGANTSAGNMLANQYASQMSGYNAQQAAAAQSSNGFGGLLGTGITAAATIY